MDTQFTGYRSMREVQDTFTHFFSPGAVQGFGSRIESALYGGRYFVTSERTYNGTSRRYTVREATQDDIVDIGEFQQYRTRGQAIAAIKKLLAPDQAEVPSVTQLELEEDNETTDRT